MNGFFCILLTMLISHSAVAEMLVGKVVGVSDGDTLTVLDAARMQHKIRLVGIDSPEKSQAHGQKSKQSLSAMVFGKDVRVEWSKTDRYDRILGKVLMPWGDVNLAQIQAGMAWHFKRYAADQDVEDRARYADEETIARQAGKGLWSDGNPVPPWEFRRVRRSGQARQ
jgi:endonuclease YncB( thermonuclease family)